MVSSEVLEPVESDSSEVSKSTDIAFNQKASVLMPMTLVLYMLGAIVVPSVMLLTWLTGASISIIRKSAPLIDEAITYVLSSIVSFTEYLFGDDNLDDYSDDMVGIRHLI